MPSEVKRNCKAIAFDTGGTVLDWLSDILMVACHNFDLNADTLARLDALINQNSVVGSRYNAQSNGEVDTENF